MCGICGIKNFNDLPVQSFSLENMMKRMKHRGPDDNGIFINKNLGFGFVRLSIIDLSDKGHQPMLDKEERFVIVHNGEVYNYKELREELKNKGYKFRSNTDSEVILYSYIEWGEDCQTKFNGMWAFAIYDKDTGDLFISRDRFGIKPFYYFLDKNKFIFASEIPSILQVLTENPEPDLQAVFDYLAFSRTDQSENTFFSGIKQLGPGCSISIKGDRIKKEKWYDLKKNIKDPFESPLNFRTVFESAISLRLQSDVPLGVCLSGGIDSSSITSTLLQKFKRSDLKTFSAIYEKGQRCDESDYIKEYKDVLRYMSFTTPDAESLLKDLPEFISAHGEPTPSAASYAQFKVMELAKGEIVVTLDGQGSDEQFAGYHYYFSFYFKGLLRNLRLLKLFSEIYHYIKIHRSVHSLKIFLYHLFPARLRKGSREKSFLTKEFVRSYSASSTVERLYDSKNLTEALINHFEKKLSIILKWEDRNSMWHSLESRVPFMDHRIVERTLSLPHEALINRGKTKVLLREAMKGVIPERIRKRYDKIGFGTPQDEWFRLPVFKKYILEMLNSEEFKNRNIVDCKKAKSIYQKHLDHKQNFADEIWKWINLDLWYKEYIEK